MLDSVRDLRHLVEDTAEDLESQYGEDITPVEILMQELGLPHTRRDDADKIIEQIRKAEGDPADVFGDNYETDSLRLTKEHKELSRALHRFVLDDMATSGNAVQMAARMLATGRRMGLREAANLMGD